MALGFNEQVWELTRKIPKGKVTTYRELAHALGSNGYRAVGNAMNRNPHAPEVPCHRVVKSDGSIGGFASGPEKKIRLLRSEGVDIIDGKIDLKKYLFRF